MRALRDDTTLKAPFIPARRWNDRVAETRSMASCCPTVRRRVCRRSRDLCIAAKASSVSSSAYVRSISGRSRPSAASSTSRRRSFWVPIVEPTMRLWPRKRLATSIVDSPPAVRPQIAIVPPRRMTDWLSPVNSPPRWLITASGAPIASTSFRISSISVDRIP